MTPKATGKYLTLEIPPDPALAGVVLPLPEAAGRLFALDRPGVLRLTLAVEEIFLYACQVAGDTGPLTLRLCSVGPSVRAEFRFGAGAMDAHALNFAARVSPEQAGAGDVGLFLASRSTDRCVLEQVSPGSFLLVVEVDRAYPEAEPIREPLSAQPPYRLQQAPPEELLRHAAMLGAGLYPPALTPQSFRAPGRLLAQARDGILSALAVADAGGRPAGLLLWRLGEGRAAFFSGPYVFCPDHREEIARLLTDGLAGALARSGVLSVLGERATPDVPGDSFETLGTLALSGGQCGAGEHPILYRSLDEDPGAQVWAGQELEAFLRERYRAMVLGRDILDSPGREPGLPARSLLATRADRRRGLALLTPLLDGWDLAENLAEHVQALRGSGLPDILFHLDLGLAWQSAMVPDLNRAGFVPRLLLPQAGVSDLLVFEHVAEPC